MFSLKPAAQCMFGLQQSSNQAITKCHVHGQNNPTQNKQNTSYDTGSKAHEKTKVIHLDAYNWKSKQYVNKFNM